uniref:Uncharacterized protein n=1 Tax=Arundo donax TaxID=35708 RepID=A0A0A8YCB5_ARUDO
MAATSCMASGASGCLSLISTASLSRLRRISTSLSPTVSMTSVRPS